MSELGWIEVVVAVLALGVVAGTVVLVLGRDGTGGRGRR
jgi:hypothetical protein